MPDDNNDSLLASIERMLARNGGDARASIKTLMDDNLRYRQRRRADKDRIAELEGKVPDESKVAVVSKADADLLARYREAGTPDEITAAMTRRDELEGTVRSTKRKQSAEVAAKAAGLNADLLIELAEPRGLTFEMRDVNKDGKTLKVPFVVQEGKEPVALADYAKATFSPSIFAALGATPDEKDGHGADDATSWPEQRTSGGTDTAKSPAKAYVEATYVRPSQRNT